MKIKEKWKNLNFGVKILLLLLMFLICDCIVFIYFFVFNFDNPDTWYPIIYKKTLFSLPLILFAILAVVVSVNISKVMRFNSIKDETYHYKDKYPEDAHHVFSVIIKNKHDSFVLAYFNKKKEICPAVYTMYGKKYSYLNLNAEEKYIKKIYLEDISSENYIRAFRLKNKRTKSQMLFFATDIKPLEIKLNGVKVPKINCPKKLGNFDIYAYDESQQNTVSEFVNINGRNYRLNETTVYNCFISENEL